MLTDLLVSWPSYGGETVHGILLRLPWRGGSTGFMLLGNWCASPDVLHCSTTIIDGVQSLSTYILVGKLSAYVCCHR